jgi:carbamoyl-phosphate synthase large subunit
MSTPRILLTCCGSPPSQNVLQSLRASPQEFYIVGCDASLHHLEWGALDKTYEAPLNEDPDFLPWLADLCQKEQIDFLHPQADRDIQLLGEHRDELPARMSLPSQTMIFDAQHKPKSASIWYKEGLRTDEPKTLMLPEDIATAVERFGLPFWMRAGRGAGATGSCKANTSIEAFAWMTYWNTTRPGNPIFAQEYLPGRNFAFHSVWFEGELVTSGVRERLEFVYPQHAVSGVTSSPVVARTVHNDAVNEMAVASIKALAPKPHGVHSMDLQEDANGVPRPTELNAGRFFNTSYYFTAAGANMPYLHIALALGLPFEEVPQYNAVPAGLYWLRHIDSGRQLVKEGDWRGVPR